MVVLLRAVGRCIKPISNQFIRLELNEVYLAINPWLLVANVAMLGKIPNICLRENVVTKLQNSVIVRSPLDLELQSII